MYSCVKIERRRAKLYCSGTVVYERQGKSQGQYVTTTPAGQFCKFWKLAPTEGIRKQVHDAGRIDLLRRLRPALIHDNPADRINMLK
ncbi:hypothetical protein EVAR_50680_1 [Eumeta japonica]|uniref:Uncharacterized protein n=1 Tax=Eumeta variegata TaxID=151549 RepID=A0A4C1XM55_EUMVA|nr:hypothetical protein EVAR_50680_1 [Eumeta japonica]